MYFFYLGVNCPFNLSLHLGALSHCIFLSGLKALTSHVHAIFTCLPSKAVYWHQLKLLYKRPSQYALYWFQSRLHFQVNPL